MTTRIGLKLSRLHELAQPVGEAIVEAAEPILVRYANDPSVSPEEFAATLLYMHCQGIDAAIKSAVNAGADPTQLRGFVEMLLGQGIWGMSNKPKTKRGFAIMTPEKQREIASLGGKASHGGGRPKGKPGGKKP